MSYSDDLLKDMLRLAKKLSSNKSTTKKSTTTTKKSTASTKKKKNLVDDFYLDVVRDVEDVRSKFGQDDDDIAPTVKFDDEGEDDFAPIRTSLDPSKSIAGSTLRNPLPAQQSMLDANKRTFADNAGLIAKSILGDDYTDEELDARIAEVDSLYRNTKTYSGDYDKKLEYRKELDNLAITKNTRLLANTQMPGTNHSILDEMQQVAALDKGDEKDKRKDKILREMSALGISQKDYGLYSGDGNFDLGNLGGYIGNSFMAGLAGFNKGIAATADVLLGGKLAQRLGWENNPLSAWNEWAETAYNENKYVANVRAQQLGGDDEGGWQFGSEVIEGFSGALPQVIMALMTAGTSTAGSAIGSATTSSSSALSTKAAYETGNLLTKAGITTSSIAKNPQFWTSFARSYGQDYEHAKDKGANDFTAAVGATASSLINGVIELGLDGGSGIQGLPSKVKNGGREAILDWAVSAAEEGGEEMLQSVVSNTVTKFLYDDEQEIFNEEELLKEGVMGTLVGGALGGSQVAVQGAQSHIANEIAKEKASQLTEEEQTVVSKLIQDKIAEAEKNGDKVTNSTIKKWRESIVQDMEKGYISTDTIEEVLGGDTYKTYKDNIDSEDALQTEYDELYKMKNGEKSDEQIDRQAELKKQLDDLRTNFDRNKSKMELSDSVFDRVKDSRLSESYNELARRHTAFEADLSKYDKKQQTVIQKAIDSGILNNTNRTHEFVDMVAKISADKGVLFDFTNNQKLKESGFAVDGKTVNGYFDKSSGTIGVNLHSAKALNTVVGHEITHVLEGTELYNELQTAIVEYAKTKGDYQGRVDALSKLYDAKDVNSELVADLVGDYLFTDEAFINNLSTNHRNVFQKIYDEVKYLLKVATAGSKEARELEKVKRAFEKAYQESHTETNEATDAEVDDVQYSVSVTDKDTLDSLNEQVSKGEYDPKTNPNGGYYVTYKSMSFWGYDKDGNAILRSPMAEYVDGELSNAYLIPKDKSKLNWYQATETIDEKTGLPSGLLVGIKEEGKKSKKYVPASENQELIAEDWSNLYFMLNKKVYDKKTGKWKNSPVPARYNPYEHSSNSMLNDQFKAAWQRDNLVTVKMYVPVSEDNGAYRAQWSKDATGWTDWKSGDVAGKINKQKDLQRRVYLSRYAAPVEIVSDSEVAQAYKGYVEGTDVSIPDNVVSPNLLAELKKAGVPITESGKVKYSLSDSTGNQLTKEQAEYFKDSKMRDADGNLLKVYHGTTNKFTTFRQGKADGWGTGIYFTDNREEAHTYGENVVEAYLNITNPYNADTMSYYDIGAENTKAYRDYDMEVWKKRYEEYDTYEEYKADGQGVDMYEIYTEEVEVFNKILRELGYDGIIADGSNGIDGLEIVAFRENQPKLTTNKTPTADPDIRYSLTEDSEGNQLSKEQAEYFKDSKARDRNGNLLKVYHTTNNDFTVFDKSRKGETTGDYNTYLGFFFADTPEYMNQFPEFATGKTETYYLNMTNPIDMNNISKQAFLDIVEATGGDVQEAAELYDSEYADEVQRAKFRGDNSPIMEMSRLLEELTGEYFDYAEFYNALKPNYEQLMSKGYDGIINSLDGRGWANEYVVLDSNQAKLTSNTNPTADSDIRYSLSEDTAMADNAIAKNSQEDMGYVPSEVMESAKALREFVANRLRSMKENGVAIPDDMKGNTAISNSSYDITEENTTICPRSLASEAFTDAVSEYLGRPLTVEEQIYISQDLQSRSLTPECVYCYVATDRKAYRAFLGEYIHQRDSVIQKLADDPKADTSRSGDLYKEFLNGRKDTNPMYSRFKMWVDSYKNGTPMIDANHLANINKLMGDINSEFGAELKPQIVDAMKYAQSASWAKKRVSYVSYDGHILKWKQNRIDKLNSHYGLRMYSFSDFHPAFVLENMQMITDASVRGLKMLGYTKDIDFVEIFAPTGMNINISTFGFESGGNVYENNIIGAEWEKAKALREQNPNVGITFVATNDTLVEWALAQDWIDVVIPYHLVRTGAEVAKAFNFHNYTDESSDVKDVGWSKDADKKYIAPTEHNNDKATYLAALAKNHLKPRFERFLGNPNYMKLVNECRQPASESQPVQPKFGEEAIKRTLAKLQANGYYQPIGGSVDRMYEIAAEVAEDMTQSLAPVRYSLSEDSQGRKLTEEQSAYFEGSKVVDENGNLKAVYHGSPADFNTFSLKHMGANGTAEGYGFYFTDKKSIAENYTRGREGQQTGEAGKLFEVYLDIKKPLSDTEVTMSRAQFRKFLLELNSQVDADGEPLDVLSNYGDVEWEGLNKVINYAMEIEYDGSDNDVNLVSSIINGTGNMETVLDVLRKTTGYDGIIVNEATWGGDQTIYLAFHPEQIKNVDNLNPTSNPDIRKSLSPIGEVPKTYGNYNVPAKDLRLEAVEDDIAPPTETVAETAETEQNVPIAEDIAPATEDLFLDNLAPAQQELEYLYAERDDIKGAMDVASAVGDYATINQLMPEYDEVQAKIAELEAPDKARLSTLDEADMPPVVDNTMPTDADEMFPDEINEPTQTPDPFEWRDMNEVRKRNVTAYMEENPAVKPFFQQAAQEMLGNVQDGMRGKRFYSSEAFDRLGNEGAWTGQPRVQSPDVVDLLDSYGFTYDRLETALNEIIDGNVKLHADAKTLEFFLDNRLRNGYETPWGEPIPANQEYIDFLKEQEITERINKFATEAFDGFMQVADQYAPDDDIAPAVEEKPVAQPVTQPIVAAEVAQKEEYEAIRPKPKKQPKMVKTTPEEQAQIAKILAEEPTPAKRGIRAWAKFKAAVLDKGAVFEDLSLRTKNRELMGKWNFMLSSEARAQRLMANGTEGVKSLKAIIEEVNNTGKTKEFYEYLYHRHNVDRMQLAERYEDTPNKPVFGDSVTAERSQKALEHIERANPKFKRYARDVYDYMNHLRQLLVDNGVISQETADLWADMYPHYVPIRRDGDNGLNINVPLDTNKTGVNAPVKRATGGSRDILPLFDTMAMRTVQTYKAIAKNSFGVELKNTLGSTIANEAQSVDGVIDSIDNQEGLLQEGKFGSNPTFTVFENGEKVTFQITKDMYDALKPTSEGLAYTNKVLNTASNFHRGLLTEYNPVFMLTNAIKDVQDVLMNSQHPARTYFKIPEAYIQMFKKGYWYTEYMENGGEQNTYFDKETNTFATENKGLKKLLDIPPLSTISKLNNFIEMTPRLAEYIASREAGRSVEVSMLDAARVTTNFAAGGDVTKFLNRNGATFLNASVQGAMQQVRNVREAKANGLKGWASLAAKFTLAGLPALLLNNLVWDDDEDYEELSDYVKQNYYVVWKYGDGQFVRIPKGRTVAVIQNAFEQVSNAITGDDEVDLKTFLELVVSNLAPNNPVDNNILSPIIQVARNETWYGEDLVPTRLQDLPAAEQYDESTDSISKWLGEKLNVSPIKINYLLNQYTGGVGDTVLPMLTPEAERGNNSFVGNVLAPAKDKFSTDSVMNNQNVSDFYDTIDELTTNAKASTATDRDVLKYKYMNSVSAELSVLYQYKREIQNSSYPDEKKYELARKAQQEIVDLMKESMSTYENITFSDGYAIIGDRYFQKNDNGEWQKLSEEQVAKYKVTSAAGDAPYATDGTNHYRWYEPDEDSDAEPGWRKITDQQLEKQEEVTSGLGISPEEYWGKKEEYDYAYEHPENYAVAKAVGGYDAYRSYSSELYDIKADKDAYGKSISGSRKEKVLDYINNLDADYGEKIILFKSEYPADDTYNYEIIDYLNSRDDISYEEMNTILKELGFTIEADGVTITWD